MWLLREALRGIAAHRARFLLTSLGVAWGGFMLTFMSAFLGGMAAHFRAELEEVGPRMVYMGTGTVLKERVGARGARTVDVEEDDVLRLHSLRQVTGVSPDTSAWNAIVRHGARTKLLAVMGWNAEGFAMRNFQIDAGRSFSPLDVARAERVAVLGPDARDRLFGPEAALGERIRIEGQPFRVIGVTVAKGDQLIDNGVHDDVMVLIPYTAMQRYIRHDETIDQWMLEPYRPEAGRDVIARSRERLGLHEGFEPANESALWSNDFWETFRIIYGMLFSIQMFYIVAGGVTLFVGAVGVMNIMLVVVGERTAEIGLRKAVGATRREVFSQFLIEALVVALAAGGVGSALGWAAVLALREPLARSGIILPESPDGLTSIAVVAALALVAVVSGGLPALRAARTPPSEALRAF
jgi:putative ABC transport system permease protein